MTIWVSNHPAMTLALLMMWAFCCGCLTVASFYILRHPNPRIRANPRISSNNDGFTGHRSSSKLIIITKEEDDFCCDCGLIYELWKDVAKCPAKIKGPFDPRYS